MPPSKLVVTTPHEPAPDDLREAERVAARLGLPLAPRASMGMARLFAQLEVEAVLVARAEGLALWLAGCPEPLRFHGGLGVPRSRNVERGGSDALVEACGLKPGDRFVDCTAGRCGDALVAEQAVGPAGQVVALESSPIVHALMETGLRQAGSRIDLVLADHAMWLRAQADRSADVVYFDPMFRRPAKSSADFEVLRAFADPRPLEPEVLAQARRVARRRVVMLDHPPGSELKRLGLRDVTASRWSSRRYGVIEAG